MADLHVPAVWTFFQENAQASLRICANRLIIFRRLTRLVCAAGQLIGKPAIGIIATADKAACLTKLQRQPALATGWTGARVEVDGRSVFLLRREEMGAKHVIHHVDDFSDAQFLGFFDQRVEICPERGQHVFPLEATARNVVELLFEVSGEVVFHVTAEEVGEEGNDDPSTLSRNKSLLVQAHVFAVLQHGND